MIAAYRDPDRASGKTAMQALITSISSGVPGALKELIALGRTMKLRAVDVLSIGAGGFFMSALHPI